MTKLSDAQVNFLNHANTVRQEGQREGQVRGYRTPFTGNREAGRAASAWYRTAECLRKRGLVTVERSGDGQVAHITPNGIEALAQHFEDKQRAEMDARREWQRPQVKVWAKEIRDQAGRGWDLLGPTIQGALVAEKVMSVIAILSGPRVTSVDPMALFLLRKDLMVECGVEGW